MSNVQTVTIEHRGESVTVPATQAITAMDELVTRLGPWVPGESKVTRNTACQAVSAEPKPVSTWERQVSDDTARERIEAQQAALTAAGVVVDASSQLYATGTRMATVGYDTQRERAREHAEKMSAKDAAGELVSIIEAEQRREVEVTARDIAGKLAINGALTFDGYKLREQAIRGLLARCGSPATGYVFGIRDRIAAAAATLKSGQVNAGTEAKPSFRDLTEAERSDIRRAIDGDKVELLDCMRYELEHVGRGQAIKLRLRDGLGDIFAAVSPGYGIADAPSVLPNLLAALPRDAKATFSYDPTTTSWEMRASVFTATPVDEQAVGEPFEGYASVTGRDNGTRGLDGGGGVMLIRCLNASVYVADGAHVRRIHRKNVLVNLHTLIQASTAAVSVLCRAWGKARAVELPAALDDAGKLVPIELAIPGFFRSMLTARRGELVGVLPGRTEKHVKALALAFTSERREPNAAPTRADLAQGFTRYIQAQPTTVRRDAERAIGSWLVKGERVSYASA